MNRCPEDCGYREGSGCKIYDPTLLDGDCALYLVGKKEGSMQIGVEKRPTISYADEFKAEQVRRLSEPNAISAAKLAKEIGVSQVTLSKWLRTANSKKEEKKQKSVPEQTPQVRPEPKAKPKKRKPTVHKIKKDDTTAIVRKVDADRIKELEVEVEEMKERLRRRDQALAEVAIKMIGVV